MKSSSKPSKSQKNKTITIHKRRVKKRGVTIGGEGEDEDENTVTLNFEPLLYDPLSNDEEVEEVSINKKTMGITIAAISGCLIVGAIAAADVLAPD